MSEPRFTLRESSGPVSPRYQYELSVEVEGAPDGSARVTVSKKQPASAGGSRDASSALDAPTLAALCDTLGGGQSTFSDAVPPGPPRVGISVNEVVLAWPGKPPQQFRYTLGAIEGHAEERRVVEALRSLARQVLEA